MTPTILVTEPGFSLHQEGQETVVPLSNDAAVTMAIHLWQLVRDRGVPTVNANDRKM